MTTHPANDLFDQLIAAAEEGRAPDVAELLARHQALMDEQAWLCVDESGFESRALAARFSFRIDKALERSAAAGRLECAKLLLAAGPKDLTHALTLAAIHDHADCAELLIQACAPWALETALSMLMDARDHGALRRLVALPSWPRLGTMMERAARKAHDAGLAGHAAAIESGMLLASTPTAAILAGRHVLKA